MPEITHDSASAYIVEHGVIRASNANDEWVAAFKSDMVAFLVALTRQSSIFGSVNISANGAIMNIKSPVNTDFRMTCDYGEYDVPTINLRWTTPGANHICRIVSNFRPANYHPVYWVIYKGTNDISVSLAEDTSVRFGSSVSSYTPPSETEWNDGHADGENWVPGIKDSMSRFTPCAFSLVEVMDSLRNKTGYGGVLRAATGGNDYQLYFTANSEIEIGGYLNTDIGRIIKTYTTTGSTSNQDIPVGGYSLLCGDSCYYPQGAGIQPATISVSSTSSPINYLGPAWNVCTACISTTMKTLYWGHMLHRDGYEGKFRPGPEVINVGTGADPKMYIRCFAAFMPIVTQENADD